jgi:K+-sensing histidine kinase KdpD
MLNAWIAAHRFLFRRFARRPLASSWFSRSSSGSSQHRLQQSTSLSRLSQPLAGASGLTATPDIEGATLVRDDRPTFAATMIPERVMVCLSSNALAPRVIRTGARIAGRLGARCYAVYVETPGEKPGRINPDDAEALHENIRLAESLGATVVRVKAERPAEGLIAFAQREGVTHIIFGQSARSRWELLWRGSTLDGFLSAVPDAAVQVVPLNEG